MYLLSFCFILCFVVVEYLATTTQSISYMQNTWDKANHCFAFFALYVLAYYSHFNFKTKTIVFTLFVLAIQIEIVQYFIPSREFSFLDIVADMVGVFLGFVFIYIVNKCKFFLKS